MQTLHCKENRLPKISTGVVYIQIAMIEESIPTRPLPKGGLVEIAEVEEDGSVSFRSLPSNMLYENDTINELKRTESIESNETT